MAAEWNSCAKLISEKACADANDAFYECIWNDGDTFGYMLNKQKELQEILRKRLPDNNPDVSTLETIGEKFESLRSQKQSIDDEYRELIDALPGMSKSEKDRSAVWKTWKGKYTEIRNGKIGELSKNDIIETKMEMIDMFHFVLNMFLALDMNSEEIFEYYYLKNYENSKRQKENY